MISLENLASRLDPARTVLFLGAGACASSGCPGGLDLALHLEEVLDQGKHHSEDLAEVCSILEVKYGRAALAQAVVGRLRDATPAGGLLTLPELEWKAIYTTNYDCLVENAFGRCHKPCVPIRSNYDYARMESESGRPIFKIHGCITQDKAFGHLASMILTEEDYDTYQEHRRYLFDRLGIDCLRNDVLVVGSALRDPHLRKQIGEVARVKREASTGRIYVVLYEQDPDRAQWWERRRGIDDVAFGSVDEIVQLLVQKVAVPGRSAEPAALGEEILLPPALRVCTVDVASAHKTAKPNARKLFHGAPATYADIEAGLTFRRAVESVLATAVRDGRLAATVLGPSGVGKTTTLRKVASALCREGFHVWEHNQDFPFRWSDWADFLGALEALSEPTVIVIDDCPKFQRDVNHLVNYAAEHGFSKTRLLLSGHTHEWNARVKSRWLYARGVVERLRLLDESDIESLLDLVDTEADIAMLVGEEFRKLTRDQRGTAIRRRSSSDMFVALKYIFASESLDEILLREYSSLSSELAEIYRYVAAVHAMGSGASRQLVIRTLNIVADQVARILYDLEDVVEEREISSAEGTYEWMSRHEVVAQTLVKYKYYDDDEWFGLLKLLIANCNPTVYFEQRMLRYLCNSPSGIRRLLSAEQRIELYQMMLTIVPTERVAWHRLVYEHLSGGETGEAEGTIRSATERVGNDPPLQRYRVLLALRRAESAVGVTDQDRRTLVRMARQEALSGVRQFHENRYSFAVLENVAMSWQKLTGSAEMLIEFTPLVREACDRILDPELDTTLRRMESGLLVESVDEALDEVVSPD